MVAAPGLRLGPRVGRQRLSGHALTGGVLAARHLGALPHSIRALLGGIGVSGGGPGSNGSALASYLLFEADFTRELMALGEKDTDARRGEVLEFFDLAVS